MSENPTSASVTGEACSCNYLQNAAEDPDNPIEFDARTNEFHFRYRDMKGNQAGELIIYHCPFCGGAAPRSVRDLLFYRIPDDEEARLAALLTPINTILDALSMLGTPESDGYSTTHYQESDDTAPTTVFRRELRYDGLSEVATICISEGTDGRAHWTLQGKHIEQLDQ